MAGSSCGLLRGGGRGNHGAAAHHALEEVLQVGAHLGGIEPVIGRAGVFAALRADEGAVFDACDVGRVGTGQVRIRAQRGIQFDEHAAVRTAAGLFDVSHMGQIKWYGKDAVKFIEKMVVGDIAGLKEGEARLSLIMNERGTIVDDTVITNAGDHIYMVVNGACKVIEMHSLSNMSSNVFTS